MVFGKFKNIIIVVVSIIVLVLILLTSVSLILDYKPKDPAVSINNDDLKYFQKDYESARDVFYKNTLLLSEKFKSLEKGSFTIPSKTDQNLTMDWCYIPSKNPGKLLVLTAGIHGPEGHAGSAMLDLFMKEYLLGGKIDNEKTGFLMVMGINAFGMKYNRRFTENNIDLNRNCPAEPDVYQNNNASYKKLKTFFQPEGKLDTGSISNFIFPVRMLINLITVSKKGFLSGLASGQYEYPDGIFYGGKDSEPQIKYLEGLLKKYISMNKSSVHYDFHTGFGKRGNLHLFATSKISREARNKVEELFKGHPIDWPDSDPENFYQTSGDFTDWVSTLVPEIPNIPMTIEYGTLDSQTVGGGILSAKTMILENQGFHYGYSSEKDKIKIDALRDELFYPSSAVWRSEIARQTRELFDMTLPRIVTKE